MSEHLLQIDATNFRFDSEEDDDEDLIKFRLRNEEQVEVHYLKPVSESKYFCDQFRSIKLYSTRSDKSIKSFIQLFEEEKVNIRYEIYRDIYTLCKYFKSNKYKILDNIFKKELFSDLEFSIRILRTSRFAQSDNETELTAKIENYLSHHVNECIKKEKFGELPISTISRIIEKNGIEKVDMASLVDFISNYALHAVSICFTS